MNRSYSAACDPRVRVGLGSGKPTLERIVVRWPSGLEQDVRDVQLNRTTTVVERTPNGGE